MSNEQKRRILIEFIIQDIVAFIIDDKSIDIDEAMNIFYNSSVFEKLQDTETGLYLEASAYVYEILKDELIYGEIVQKEE